MQIVFDESNRGSWGFHNKLSEISGVASLGAGGPIDTNVGPIWSEIFHVVSTWRKLIFLYI